MSYILDALRRADAERERGGVPGLHAQPLRGEADDEAKRGGLPWAGIAIALALTLAVVLAWLTLAPGSAPEPLPAAPAPPVAAAPLTPAAPAVADVPAPIVAPPPAPTQAATPAPVAAPKPAPRAAAPVAKTETPRPKKAAPAVAHAPAAAASAAAPEARIPTLRELPEDLRRQIPALAVGGSTWSENAASRFVIINGQLLRENDALSPELTLRLIRQRAAIFEFRGQRFELGF